MGFDYDDNVHVDDEDGSRSIVDFTKTQLETACIRKGTITASSFADNTVDVLMDDGSIETDLPILVNTDIGSRARKINGETIPTTDPAGGFKNACTIQPMEGGAVYYDFFTGPGGYHNYWDMGSAQLAEDPTALFICLLDDKDNEDDPDVWSAVACIQPLTYLHTNLTINGEDYFENYHFAPPTYRTLILVERDYTLKDSEFFLVDPTTETIAKVMDATQTSLVDAEGIIDDFAYFFEGSKRMYTSRPVPTVVYEIIQTTHRLVSDGSGSFIAHASGTYQDGSGAIIQCWEPQYASSQTSVVYVGSSESSYNQTAVSGGYEVQASYSCSISNASAADFCEPSSYPAMQKFTYPGGLTLEVDTSSSGSYSYENYTVSGGEYIFSTSGTAAVSMPDGDVVIMNTQYDRNVTQDTYSGSRQTMVWEGTTYPPVRVRPFVCGGLLLEDISSFYVTTFKYVTEYIYDSTGWNGAGDRLNHAKISVHNGLGETGGYLQAIKQGLQAWADSDTTDVFYFGSISVILVPYNIKEYGLT